MNSATRELIFTCVCRAKSTAPIPSPISVFRQAFDPYYGYALFLTAPVGRNVLWAYNRRHLEFIREYVAAKLRPRTPHQNSTLVSRLPTWIKRAKNADAILREIDRLEAK